MQTIKLDNHLKYERLIRMRFSAILFLSLFGFKTLLAQELNCTVQVLSPQLVTTDKRVFDALRTSIMEFMNNRKWTKDIYQSHERIECSILINVSEQVSTTEFRGSIQVQSRRPIYQTSYNSVLFNFNDDNFQFKYTEFQPMEFNENSHISNLTSVLAYYAYIILGLDYDSYELMGGTPYFQLAQKIMTNAQSASEAGWKSFESTKNRYWLISNILDKPFIPLREVTYEYHRLGLDVLTKNLEQGRTTIIKSLKKLQALHQSRPLSFNMRVFFNAKSDEVVDIFSEAYGSEKQEVLAILGEIDPGNNNKYQKINENN